MQSELTEIRKSVRNALGAIESNQMIDKDVHGTLSRVLSRLDDLTAELSDKQAGEVNGCEWHRADRPGGGSAMLYTLREEGRRRGEPVMTNDVMINIDRGTGSSTDIEPIVQRIRSALVDVPAVEPVAGYRRRLPQYAFEHYEFEQPGYESPSISDWETLYTHPPLREGEDSAEVTAAIRSAGIKARDELLERMADGGSVDNDLADYMSRIVDACERAALAATRSGSATTASGDQP